MKMIVLNAWGGIMGDRLLDFFEKYRGVDAFLLQEVFSGATEKTFWDERENAELFKAICSRLPDHTGYFAPSVVHEWGLAMFVRTSLGFQDIQSVFVHKTMDSLIHRDGSSIGRNVQWGVLQGDGTNGLVLANFHGIWAGHGVGKGDTEERLEQSKNLIAALQPLSHSMVLCGDFNLNPDTESLRVIERDLGLRNLINEYGITSTRTSLYQKPGKFASYVLVSPNIEVRDFQILPDEVSDHAALLLEIGTLKNH